MVGLVGWLTGVQTLITITPGQPPMMPNTALALLLLGLAGTLRHPAHTSRAARSLSALAAVVVLALGLGTIAEYVLNLPFSIDQLIVRSETGPYPGRPSPPVAIAIILLSGAILALKWRTKGIHPWEWLIVGAGLISFGFAVAQLFGAGPLYQFSDLAIVGVAVPTAISLMLISVGLLLEQPDSVIMRIANSPTPGAMMVRRLIPTFIVIALGLDLAASLLTKIVGDEHVAFMHAGLALFGIAMVVPLFVITAQHLNRAEHALRLSEAAAKRATQARDDMLGVVAHDLRNPLAVIASLAAVLQRKGPGDDIGDEIAHAAARMNRLIRDLVDVTLLDAGTFTIKQERTRPDNILSEVLESQALLASSASLELRLDAVPDLSDIWADHDRLLQVFENLIGNAIKFTKPGGEVVLSARAGAGEVLFSVADTGSGIESDQLPRVFDRFWQAPEGKRRGAGLGLPIVKGIVEAHGGRIWVQSTPGQGSTFFFTISALQVAHYYPDATLDTGSRAESVRLS